MNVLKKERGIDRETKCERPVSVTRAENCHTIIFGADAIFPAVMYSQAVVLEHTVRKQSNCRVFVNVTSMN